jgi:calcineurin-like phosphoesterase family protein
MTDWFTSDSHYYHRNIIKYQNRPFASIEEMNEGMIKNWNDLVKPDDHVFHLGDFSFGDTDSSQLILNRLIGHKHLILGNHDKPRTLPKTGWESIDSIREISVKGHKVILCHYAMRVWNRSHHESYMLYGHSHGHLPGTTQSQDVGVDVFAYKPVTFEQILAKMKTNKPYSQEDFHDGR